jgi:hypothetical protein
MDVVREWFLNEATHRQLGNRSLIGRIVQGLTSVTAAVGAGLAACSFIIQRARHAHATDLPSVHPQYEANPTSVSTAVGNGVAACRVVSCFH